MAGSWMLIGGVLILALVAVGVMRMRRAGGSTQGTSARRSPSGQPTTVADASRPMHERLHSLTVAYDPPPGILSNGDAGTTRPEPTVAARSSMTHDTGHFVVAGTDASPAAPAPTPYSDPGEDDDWVPVDHSMDGPTGGLLALPPVEQDGHPEK